MSLHSVSSVLECATACSLPISARYATRTGMGGFPEGWAPGEHYPKNGRVVLPSISLVVI